MKKKRIRKLIVIFIVLSVLFIINIAFFNPFLPIYPMEGKVGDKQVSIAIDGVRYQMYPELKWDVNYDNKIIGYAGNIGIAVYGIKGDSKMNFIYLSDSLFGSIFTNEFGDRVSLPFYRTDVTIPAPSAESVDTINYHEFDFYGYSYNNALSDKQTIEELFGLLNNSEKAARSGSVNTRLKSFNIEISCVSNQVPGAYYILNICSYGGKLVCGNNDEGYAEVHVDFLEKIAGHKLNLNDLIPQA